MDSEQRELPVRPVAAPRAAEEKPAQASAPAAPMSMLDAVGRLSPDQAGLLGVLIGLRRMSDEGPGAAAEAAAEAAVERESATAETAEPAEG